VPPAKGRLLGIVEAADADEAIEKAAKEFKVITSKLIAARSDDAPSAKAGLRGLRADCL